MKAKAPPRKRPQAPTLTPDVDPDPGLAWARAVRQLAASFGLEPAALIDQHAARATARRYCGEPVDSANAAAFQEIQALYGATREAA